MTKKVFASFLSTLLAVLLIAITAIMLTVYAYLDDMHVQQMSADAYYIAAAMGDDGLTYLEEIGDQGDRITWIAADGQVLYDNRADILAMDNHANREEVIEAMEQGSAHKIRYSDTLSQRTIYYALLLEDGTILRISCVRTSLYGMFQGIFQLIAITLAILALLSFFLAKGVTRSLVRPIEKIDLEHPENAQVYEELQPLMRKLALQKKLLTLQLEDREKSRREFTANVSHELKTPLTSISGYAEIIKDGMVRQEDIPKFAATIYDESSRLITLVGDILKLSRLDESDNKQGMAMVSLKDIVREEVCRLTAVAERKQVVVEANLEDCEILGSAQVLGEMIYNLIDNAIKYNRQGGWIHISVSRLEASRRSAGKQNAGKVVFQIEDSGIGISQEDRERIFERFYRVDKSHSKEIGGTGLGLSIVKHAALLHEATIVVGGSIGQGTTITITFPNAINFTKI